MVTKADLTHRLKTLKSINHDHPQSNLLSSTADRDIKIFQSPTWSSSLVLQTSQVQCIQNGIYHLVHQSVPALPFLSLTNGTTVSSKCKAVGVVSDSSFSSSSTLLGQIACRTLSWLLHLRPLLSIYWIPPVISTPLPAHLGHRSSLWVFWTPTTFKCLVQSRSELIIFLLRIFDGCPSHWRQFRCFRMAYSTLDDRIPRTPPQASSPTPFLIPCQSVEFAILQTRYVVSRFPLPRTPSPLGASPITLPPRHNSSILSSWKSS